jgi:hypothetical protein
MFSSFVPLQKLQKKHIFSNLDSEPTKIDEA